jgi:hypothetical protein
MIKDKTLIAKILAGFFGLFLLSAGSSYIVFSRLASNAKQTLTPYQAVERRPVDLSAPRTEPCPLNGKMYTKAERDIWETRRPLGVMIENHQEARPQSGLSQADVVYEAVAEGGITRFLAIFYCDAARDEVTVGPIRSARTYFLDWISEYGISPLYAHVGGANKPGPADALGQIRKYGWEGYNDLNQFSIGFPTFWRDYDRLGRTVATEHTMYSTTDKLWAIAASRGLSNMDKQGVLWNEGFVPWKFADGKPTKTPISNISYDYWEGYSDYTVLWTYDPATNSYKRTNGGRPHTDLNNNQQIQASNVVIIFTKVTGPIDELKHMLYETSGKGKALVFQNGELIEATWNKESRTARMKFLDNKGREITFVRGPIWISVLQNGSKVVY